MRGEVRLENEVRVAELGREVSPQFGKRGVNDLIE